MASALAPPPPLLRVELKVNKPAPFEKCSSIMTFPARLKSHSALNVYFPIGESLLMKTTAEVESIPSLVVGVKGAYTSTDLNLNGAAT